MNNYTKDEVIYIHNVYLKAQAIKLLKQHPDKRSQQDRDDFWYVFHKLVPGYMGRDLRLGASVQTFVHYYNIRVVVGE